MVPVAVFAPGSSYLCIGKSNERHRTRSVRNADDTKNKMIMRKEVNKDISMLRYRLSRYQAMGNGTMCQRLNGEIRKLENARNSCN